MLAFVLREPDGGVRAGLEEVVNFLFPPCSLGDCILPVLGSTVALLLCELQPAAVALVTAQEEIVSGSGDPPSRLLF